MQSRDAGEKTRAMELRHGIRVFVFSATAEGTLYLLLRPKPKQEWPWVPVVGSVNLDEHLQGACLREVQEETGIQRPVHLIDLKHQDQTLVGDLGLVEWQFAYQVPTAQASLVKPGPRIHDLQWLPFETAFREMESGTDREGLVRVEVSLSAG